MMQIDIFNTESIFFDTYAAAIFHGSGLVK
jgi:hypothetical protein